MAVILYVEDHPPAQLLMSAIINEMTSHQLVVADSSSEAIKAASSTVFDLYILDHDLPDGDGLSLAARLNSLQPAPIILISAYAEAISATALPAYIRFYLAKPLNPDHVAETIQRALAG
jgi:CheY-like chemotaxis protein